MQMLHSIIIGLFNLKAEALTCYSCALIGCSDPFSPSATGVEQLICPTSGTYSCAVRLFYSCNLPPFYVSMFLEISNNRWK